MKKISNWLIGIWLAICSTLQVWPGALLQAWMMMPDDLKAAIPPIAVKAVSYSVLVLSFLAKMHFMNKDKKDLQNQVNQLPEQTSDAERH